MTPEVAALAIGAIVVAALSWRDKRAVGYIMCGAVSFAANYMWGVKEMPYPPVMNALFDGALCLLIYVVAKRQWERWLYLIFQTSVIISMIELAGWIPGPVVYAIALEAVNWAALLLIGGTALARMVGDGGSVLGPADRLLRRLDAALRTPRSPPHWWHA